MFVLMSPGPAMCLMFTRWCPLLKVPTDQSVEPPGELCTLCSHCEQATMRGQDGCKPRRTHWSQLAPRRNQTFSLVNARVGTGNKRQHQEAEKALKQEGSCFTDAQVPRAAGSCSGAVRSSLASVYSQVDQTEVPRNTEKGEGRIYGVRRGPEVLPNLPLRRSPWVL